MADRYFSTEEEAIQDLVRRGLVVDSGQKRWCQRNASMVRGGENGFWELRLASGRWKQIPNAYQQALDEKMAVRDAMAEFAGGAVPYPDAALVFVPAIPAGS